ncbi:hypothetical protein P153DRAFT_368876 [Dothidotthia symphoricarpi CBS 119687]|uniref:Uncharacterized protein n=1 Tax=Dothidotthia symphoricarpi CBS 119687 TaxID=1392245 RepID=A0A6A6A4L6_9PLEO|nr:uncharacterized protein P153DRAFT_368876 [Dothidotthia symphoricarpi CBS 119687]KAF2126839.1 hypothetical protein P153DRAFT_368876 [Dothidotthia symphoricarpi CBS 119687]
MRSTSRRLPDEAGSFIDDSTYELLGDSLLATSDDEAHTESIASTDTPTPDDASEFSDDDDDFETQFNDVQHSVDSLNAEATEQQLDAHLLTSGDSSTLTEIPSHMDSSEDSRRVRLDEQPTNTSGVVHGSKAIRSLPDQTSDLPPVFMQYECSEIRLVVKAALSERPMPTPDSYKILYVGMPEQWLADVITSQIGNALIASPSASRSVMVGGQIEPYGPVIHTYRCTSLVSVVSENGDASYAKFNLDDGRHITIASRPTSNSETQPDLVIFCHPSIPGSVKDVQEFASAREVVRRQKFPYIDLAQARPYGEGVPTYNSHSLSVCVEGRKDPSDDYQLKEVLPLDHYLFSELEPSQLNRHLAHISPHLAMPASGSVPKTRGSVTSDTYHTHTKKMQMAWPNLKMLLIYIVMTGLVSVYFLNSSILPMVMHKVSSINIESFSPASASISSVPLSSTVLSTPAMVSALPSPSLKPTSKDLAYVPPQEKQYPKSEQGTKKEENTNIFGIEITGEHQFVLCPSIDLPSSRKKPQIQILVSRNSQTVPVRSNRSINGVYVVDLEHEYPLSQFNVSITTHSRPTLQQSFHVALGSKKSAYTQFLNTAKRGLRNTQSSFWNVSSTITQQIQAGLVDLNIGTHLLAGHPSQEVVNHLQGAKEAVERQLAVGSEVLKQAPGSTWMGLRKATAPIRTSTPVLRARTNALRLRCKMEIAAGLSSKDVAEEQSWACSQVRGNPRE